MIKITGRSLTKFHIGAKTDMTWTIRKNYLNYPKLFENGIQVRNPSEAELEFWARIKELETEIAKLKEEKHGLPRKS